MNLSLHRSFGLTGSLIAMGLLLLFALWSPATQPQPPKMQPALTHNTGVPSPAIEPASMNSPVLEPPVLEPPVLEPKKRLASIAPTIRPINETFTDLKSKGGTSTPPNETHHQTSAHGASPGPERNELRIIWAAQSSDRSQSNKDLREIVSLLESYAEQQFLIPTWVPVPTRHHLIPALEAGLGDIIGTPLAPDYLSERGIRPSLPVGYNQEVLITRAADSLKLPWDLAGKQLALTPHSPFWRLVPDWIRTLQNNKIHPFRMVALDTTDNTRASLDQLLNFNFDVVSIRVPSRGIESLRRSGLRIHNQHIVDRRPVFGLAEGRPDIERSLNAFLNHQELARRAHERYKADLIDIKKRKVLRVLTRNNSTDYFVWRGELLGFEFEMARRFADELGISLEMVVVSTRQELYQALLRGEGDMIAAGITIQNSYRNHGIEYTRPYDWVRQQIIGRAEDQEMDILNLQNKAILVHKSSAAWRRLAAERQNGARFLLEPADESEEVEELIQRVSTGHSDYAVVDSNVMEAALRWREDVRVVHEFIGQVPHAWAVRADSPELRSALNDFLKREHRSLFYNLTYAKYFQSSILLKQHAPLLSKGISTAGNLSPYDDIVKRVASQYDFDWSLLIAVMYRESRFDPVAKSWAGAEGLMQVLPRTARHFGVSNLTDPESGITAGVRMLDWLYARMEANLPIQERTWFSLAAYNAGLGHLRDARQLAAELGLNPNRWFGNVERAMMLLSKPEYYRRAQHGFVRGKEPVEYVRDIRKLYHAYRKMG